MTKKIKSSEVHAYSYIKEQLKILGWDVRNPSKNDDGEVYTQNECLQELRIKACLILDKPENIVKLSENDFWIIEAKPEHSALDTALKEAQDYGDKLNKSNNIKCLIVTGVAGNDEDTYLIKHLYWDGTTYLPITLNGQQPTGLLSKELAQELLRTQNPNIQDIPLYLKKFFFRKQKVLIKYCIMEELILI